MKKFNILAAVLMAGSLAFSACEKQDNSPVMQEPTVFVLNTPAYVNTTYDLENSTSLELTCSQPDYGFTAAVTYQVEVSLTDDWTDPETTYAVLGTTYNTARINVDAADLAASLTALSGKDESAFPFITEVYVRLRASLTASGKGEIVSNVVVLPNVRLHYALPPVNAPEAMYINGQCNGWDWGAAFKMVDVWTNSAANGNDGSSRTFWRIAWMPADGGFKINSAKSWNGDEVGFAGASVTDNANAGISASDDGNIVVANEGWYLIVVNVSVSGRDLVYSVTFNEPAVYLIGLSAPSGTWDILAENMFEVPASADGMFKSPALAADLAGTDEDGCFRACIKLDGQEWWHTEFMVFDGVLKFRSTGGDQDRVGGKAGQSLYISFTDETGEIK